MIEYKSVSLANQVFEALQSAILRGEFEYGELVSEKKLAEKLGVSRTPVREAMTRLSQDRLIKDTVNGSIILGIQTKDLRDLLIIKQRIEPLIAVSLTENMTEKELNRLKDIVDQQEFYSSKDDYEKVMRLDTEFHDAMYQISGSIVFETVLSQVHHKLLKYRLASLKDEKRIRESTGEHKLIVSALAEGNASKVEELLLLHVDHAYNSIMKGATDGTDNSREDN